MRTMLRTAVVLMLLLIGLAPAHAEVRQATEVTIAIGEVIDDDVYVFAQTVTIDGVIRGDLVVAGQKLHLNGSVDGDLIAAAQEISINGTVSDDARIAGQILTLRDDSEIGDDLIAAGYRLECTEGSRIAGEVKFAGYESVFAGKIDQRLELASTSGELSGSFGGDVEAIVGGGAEMPGLTIRESAEIAGDLTYRSTHEADIHPDSTIAGEVEYSEIESAADQPPTLADRATSFAKQYLASLVVGLLIICVCPHWMGQVVDNVGRRPLASLGWGVLALIIAIAGAILALVGIIVVAVLLGTVFLEDLIPAWLGMSGLTTALAVVGFLVFATWIARVIIGAWVGNRIIPGPGGRSKRSFLALTLGLAIVAVMTWLPTIGGAIGVVVMLMGIGSTAIWMLGRSRNVVPVEQGT